MRISLCGSYPACLHSKCGNTFSGPFSTLYASAPFDSSYSPCVVIYAPPNSGKSTFSSGLNIYDTDCEFSQSPVMITNLFHVVSHFSSAKRYYVLPDRHVFDYRLKARGLFVKYNWYNDLRLAIHSDPNSIVLESNKFVGQLLSMATPP